MGNRTSVEEIQMKAEKAQSWSNTEENECTFKEDEDIIIKCRLGEMVRRFFEDYIIVWHDPHLDSEENKGYIQRLEKFCEVKTFKEWEKAALYIRETKAYCHVITSGTNGEPLINEIEKSFKITAIYIFCINKGYHKTWAKSNEKISCVETRIEYILDKIEENLLKWYKKESNLKMNLPAFAPVFTDWDRSGINNLHLYLKAIPNFKNRSQAKDDFLALSKRIYSDKMNTKFMAEFEKNYNKYKKEEILKWYTQESFVLKVTNNCLRIASSDSIQYCRLVLKDLERAIKSQYRKKSKRFHGLLYRTASLSEKEWSNLKANLHKEIEMHGFLSTSKDKNQALKFIQMDESKNVFITILVPKSSINGKQGFVEVEEFSRFPQEKEIIFNVRSRFTILEAEDKYSEDFPFHHLVLFYGAQEFRKFVTEKNPVQEISISNVEHILCTTCKDEISQNMFFAPITREKVQSYCCQKCLSDFVKTQKIPLLCVPQGQPIKQITLQGVLVEYPTNLEVPMFGYKCLECQAKKQKMYYKCTECRSEKKRIWCENCIESSSECQHNGHHLILETSPFSFWCDKMSQEEFIHLKFQSEILKFDDIFQQAHMYVESHEYQKAIKYYETYIKQHQNKKVTDLVFRSQRDSKASELIRSKNIYIAASYNNLGEIYTYQEEYQKALKFFCKALEIESSCKEVNQLRIAGYYDNMGEVYSFRAEWKKALECHSKALKIRESLYGNHHPYTAISYSRLGEVYKGQAKYEKALEYYSKALKIHESVYEGFHPYIATSYRDLGGIYENQAEYEKALEYYSRALQIEKTLFGGNHPNIAVSYRSLGRIYKSQAEYEKALDYSSKALEIEKLFYGDNHHHIANSYRNLGSIYKNQAEYKKALEFYCKAFEIDKSFYGTIILMLRSLIPV